MYRDDGSVQLWHVRAGVADDDLVNDDDDECPTQCSARSLSAAELVRRLHRVELRAVSTTWMRRY